MMETQDLSVVELMRIQRLRRWQLTTALVVLVTLVFGSMGLLPYFAPRAPWIGMVGIGLAVVAMAAIPVAIWNEPRRGLYILLLAVFLFEVAGSTVITGWVPFFLNLNSYGQSMGSEALAPFKFNVAEVVMVLALFSWLIRQIATRSLRLYGGPFLFVVGAYMVAVAMGFVRGMTTGGDLIKALWEVRPQVYLGITYLMAANMLTEVRHIKTALWIIVVGTGFKGLLGLVLYVQSGGNVSVDGMLGHEESLYFNLLFFIAILSPLVREKRRLGWTALALVPAALVSTFANQRRAGIAAFMIAFIPLVPLLWVVLKDRRAQVARFAVAFGAVMAVYLPIAWNSEGAWALPARAIRSHSSPNARDNQSNVYRYMEDANLKYSRDLSPLIGVGYGKPWAQIYTLPAVTTDMLNYYAHNSVLWVWMRLGTVGFFAFIMLIAVPLVHGGHIVQRTKNPTLLMMAILAMLYTLMFFTYAKYDLQLVNYRSMVLAGILLGALAAIPRIERHGDSLEPADAPVHTIEPAGRSPVRRAGTWGPLG